MDQFLFNKMTSLFTFPQKNGKINEDFVIYSYIALSIMSRFANTSEGDIEDNYYANHRELMLLGINQINAKWATDEEIGEDKSIEIKRNMVISMEKNLERFGHLANLSLDFNSKLKHFVTQDKHFSYKNISFKMGLPISLLGRKISGCTIIEPFSNKYPVYEIGNGMNLDLVLVALSNEMIDFFNDELFVQDLGKIPENLSSSWVNVLESKDFDFNIGMKKENNHAIYYLVSKKGKNIKTKRFDDCTYIAKNFEHRRYMNYIRKLNNTPYYAKIMNMGNDFIQLRLPFNLPSYEMGVLYNIGWPINGFKDRLHFYIRKEFEEFVIDLLHNCFIEVDRK